MREVSSGDAEEIFATILRIRGISSKSQKAAKEGNLTLTIKKFTYKALFKMRQHTGTKVDWTRSPKRHDARMEPKCIKLEAISYPECHQGTPMHKMNLRNRHGRFSNIMCKG